MTINELKGCVVGLDLGGVGIFLGFTYHVLGENMKKYVRVFP
ncbi:MAG: hypothetical protein ABF380_12400 [Akkermansiaceae bacterium]